MSLITHNQEHKDIPLDELGVWDGNARKTSNDAEMEELVASVQAHGILQPLAVIKTKKGKYEVVAGKRRMLALHSLAAAGKITNDYRVPCNVIPDKLAAEASIAENTIRVPMHPADQFEAFRDLIERDGKSIADVAAAFGVTEHVVRQRLKLGKVSPKLLDEYRNDNLDLTSVQAYALTDDHKRQEELYESSPSYVRNNAFEVRRHLNEGKVAGSSTLARFVGLEAYEQAGGIVERDLFSDGEDTFILADRPLLEKIAMQMLNTEAEKVKAEGWAWVECHTNVSYSYTCDFKREYGDTQELPQKTKDKIATLRKEAQALADKEYEPGVYSEEEQKDDERYNEIEDEIEVLEDTAEVIWNPDIIKRAGAIVSVGFNGKLDIERGWIKPETAEGKSSDGKPTDEDKPKQAPEVAAMEAKPSDIKLSKDITIELTGHRTAILAAELSDNPDIALAVTVHKLLERLVTQGWDSQIGITPDKTRLPESIKENGGSKAAEHVLKKLKALDLPSKREELFIWCCEHDREKLLDILALCTALTVDTIEDGTRNGKTTKYAKALGAVLKIDVNKWFEPTAENYFGRINKLAVFLAMREAGKLKEIPSEFKSMKKAALATAAQTFITEKDPKWLPELLRFGAQKPKPKKAAAKKPKPQKMSDRMSGKKTAKSKATAKKDKAA